MLTILVLALMAVLLAGGRQPARAESNAAAEVTGPPLLNGPVFNDPLVSSGTQGVPSPQQSAVMDQLIRLIKATQPGGEINLAMHEFKPGQRSSDVVFALIDAHNRGVKVKVILDGQEDGDNDVVFLDLSRYLYTDESADSWVVNCEYPDPGQIARGCIAKNYLHSKFAVFSKVRVDGVDHPAVVFQTSSNLSDWYLYNSYNDAYTFTVTPGTPDAAAYDGYRKYFRDLQLNRHGSVNPGYFWATPEGTKHRALFYPRERESGDPVYNILDLVKCSYQDADGVRRQTDVRMALTGFQKSREAIARKLLELRGQGCWIDIVFLEQPDSVPVQDRQIDGTIRSILNSHSGNPDYPYIQTTPCRIPAAGTNGVVPHTKLMMLDGFYHDDIVPRVYTGSANFYTMENSDDSTLRIMGRDTHSEYLSWFYKLRRACAAAN
jgi:phosphatidylserine/phosphatidylglycerophosphate/cardiolipin synthase-like enzyme